MKIHFDFRKILTDDVFGGVEVYKSIDLLRAVASLAVLIVHYKHFFQGASTSRYYQTINQIDTFRFWEPFFLYGSNAVQLFWVISGFVFLHVYGGKICTLKNYITNRVARLYPLHFVTLLIVAILQFLSLKYVGSYNIYQINDPLHFVLNLFFASEWWGGAEERSFNAPIWSVSVEIFSYIIFYVILKYFKINILSIIFIIMMSAILYIIRPNMIFLCLIYFFSGCLSYATLKLIKIYSIFSRYYFSFMVIVFFVSFCFAIIEHRIPRILIYMPMFGSLLICLVTVEEHYKFKFLRKISWIGNTSYGNYLWHSPLQMLFLLSVSFKLINFDIVYNSFFLPIYLITVVLFSTLSWNYFERPAQVYIKKLFFK